MSDFSTTYRTTKTLREILKGPDCPERRERVRRLVAVFQPVWERVAKAVLVKYGAENATLDAEDVVGGQIKKMLDPDGDYFKTYDPDRSVRSWIKGRIRHRALDLLRKRSPDNVEPNKVGSYIDQVVDEAEFFEIFRHALELAEEICERRDRQEDMEIFRAVRSSQHKLPPEERRERGWTEWQERKAVNRVWDLVEREALPLAAEAVSDTPQDAEELARRVWDMLKRRKSFDLPHTDGGEDDVLE